MQHMEVLNNNRCVVNKQEKQQKDAIKEMMTYFINSHKHSAKNSTEKNECLHFQKSL